MKVRPIASAIEKPWERGSYDWQYIFVEAKGIKITTNIKSVRSIYKPIKFILSTT